MAEHVGDGGSGWRPSLTDWAAKLRGDIGRDDQQNLVIRAPGPGHHDDDRSLSVWLDEDAPQGFRVHSFSIRDGDFTSLRDYVRDTCGAPEWKPQPKANGKANGHDAHREVVEHYVYQNIDGQPVLRVTRWAPKHFTQSRPDGAGGWEPGGIPEAKRVPYKLPEFTEAGALGATVYVHEGEKAARLGWAKGLPSTCSSGGAGKWGKDFAKFFVGLNVIILADADIPGRKHADMVLASLEPVAASVRIIHLPGLPPGGDFANWIAAGNDPAIIPTLRPGPPAKGHTAAELWDMVFPPIQYAVPGYIAEGLTLFAGAPKRGKSWLALDLCCSVAWGGFTLGDQHCIEGDVLYAALEDSPRRIKDRLRRVCQLAGRAPERMTVWFGDDLKRLGDGCEDELRAWLTDHPQARLVVIDTLNYIRPNRTKDEDPYSYDYRSATTLQRLAQDFKIAIIIIHHTRKTAADDYLESISGTNGLTGGSDAVMVLEKGSEGGFVLKGRGRDIEEFETAVKFDRNDCKWHVIGDAAEARVSDTRAAILAVLAEAGFFMSVGDIAVQVGRTRNTVDQQLWQMVKAGIVERHGRGKYGLPGRVIDGDNVVPLHPGEDGDDQS
jgi:hypothetical protein